jgi:tetratricopeptide (TPR) repeat protein
MRPRTKALAVLALALAIGAGALLGGVLLEGAPGSAGAPRAQSALAVADLALAGVAPSSAAADLEGLERAVAERPESTRELVLLGYAYQQRWRETADASFLPRSQAALRRALRLEPRDPLAVVGLGNLALIRHEFRSALTLGRKARALAPFSARPYGIVGDALVELGRHREAFAAFERMVALKPSLASYARIAYARELLGDLRGAEQGMRLALDASGGQPEPAAWTYVELGKLHFARGRVALAEQSFRAALRLLPGYVYATDQLARVEAARGRYSRAIALERRAVEAVPLPQFVGQLADLLDRVGRKGEARRQVATVKAIDRLLGANGVRTDLEAAVFDADRRLGVATLVERARRARADRPSVYGDDALAWALARAGRCDEALSWSQRALRLGTRDALLWFHRAEIERCRGNRGAARTWARRALALNPAFSVRWAPAARRLAAGGR